MKLLKLYEDIHRWTKVYEKLDGEIELGSLNVYVCKNGTDNRRNWEALNVWLDKKGDVAIVEKPGGFHAETESIDISSVQLSDDKLSVTLKLNPF